MTPETLMRILAAVPAVFLVLFMVVPFTYGYGTFVNLDGSPSVMDHDWSQYGAGGWIYALGDLLCHQEMDRCFILNGSQMPICARDLGLLIGITAGLFFFAIKGLRKYDRRMLLIGLLMLSFTFIEWAWEHAFDGDSMGLRFVLAMVSGFGAAMIVIYVVSYKLVPEEE
jgi:uncharacterized membrane protein